MKAEKFQNMIERIQAGETLILATTYHATKITKTAFGWRQASDMYTVSQAA